MQLVGGGGGGRQEQSLLQKMQPPRCEAGKDADGDCSHEIKRHLLLGREVMTNLDSILKRRDITPEVGDGQGGLACCDSWGRKELDVIEQLNTQAYV